MGDFFHSLDRVAMEAFFDADNDLCQRRFNFFFGLCQQTSDGVFDLLDESFGIRTRAKLHFRIVRIEITLSWLGSTGQRLKERSKDRETC
ncbi:Uncharacterised protein [Enterobacter hormaechei]|nr:Uncharacterised protein [Enterobacter hormaechei]